MPRGGRREGAGRPRKSVKLLELTGQFRADRHKGRLTAVPPKPRRAALEERRRTTLFVIRNLERRITENAGAHPAIDLPKTCREFRHQTTLLMQIDAVLALRPAGTR